MDQFYEQFQTKDYGRKEKALNLIRDILFILGIFSVVFLDIIRALFFIILGILTIIYIKNNILEYEYELTEKELVITKIMNRSKRKIIGTINISNITEVKALNEAKKTNRKIINACLEGVNIKDQVIFAKTDDGLMGYHVAMDDTLLKMANRINPLAFRKV